MLVCDGRPRITKPRQTLPKTHFIRLLLAAAIKTSGDYSEFLKKTALIQSGLCPYGLIQFGWLKSDGVELSQHRTRDNLIDISPQARAAKISARNPIFGGACYVLCVSRRLCGLCLHLETAPFLRRGAHLNSEEWIFRTKGPCFQQNGGRASPTVCPNWAPVPLPHVGSGHLCPWL